MGLALIARGRMILIIKVLENFSEHFYFWRSRGLLHSLEEGLAFLIIIRTWKKFRLIFAGAVGASPARAAAITPYVTSFGPEISVQAVCKRLFICFLLAVFSPLQLQLQGSMGSCVFQFYFPLLEPRFITSTLVVTVSVVPTWKQYRIGTTRAY